MPPIDRNRWRDLEPLLDHALTLPAEERTAWLETLQAHTPELVADLTSLLSGESEADRRGFLAEPPVMGLAGLELGAYTLERPLGQGGMGSVWLARRTDGRFEGQAAVKLMNLALVSPAGQERFRREGTVLARLRHPGIARLLDAGVAPSGQPYLVIEYVDGERIDAFAAERELSREDRIRLVLQVLEAVGQAHANLIVHRDIKPSNILVTADGSVKLLDFGIAKLLEAEGDGERTALTGDGRALTPDYAAPEQVRGEVVTTATDVYATGVLLYLLLSGHHPTAGSSHTPAEAVRAVLEVEPARLGLGDLDSIIAKALRKAPSERYQTVATFADDLRRYLRQEPVSARPDSLAYRARKFARRNRWALAAVGSIVLLLGAYAVTVTLQRVQIRRALVEATLGTQKAEQVTDFMLGLFEAAEGGKALTDTVTARELLGRGLASARELTGQPGMQAQMLDVIGRLYTQLGEYDRARPLLEEALAIRRAEHGEHHPDVATSLENLARVTDQKADVERTVALRREALALRRRLSGTVHPKTLDAVWDLGSTLHRAGDHRAAEPLFDEWMAAIARQDRAITRGRAEQLISAANLLRMRGETDRPESMFREALEIRRALYGDRHHLVAASLTELGSFLDMARRREQAEPLLREAVAILRTAYPDGHPQLASTLKRWGVVLEHLGRFPEAQAPLREALALRRRFAGEHGIDVAQTELDLSYALTMSGAYDEAASLARDAVRLLRAELGVNSSMVAFAQIALGDALRGQGKYATAESLLVAGYQRFEIPKPVTRQWRAYALAALVRLYDAEGRPNEAARYRALWESSLKSVSAPADRRQ